MRIFRKYQGAFLRIIGYEEAILSCRKSLSLNFHIVSKFNGGILIGACSPGRGFAAAKTQVSKTYGDQLAPYPSFAAFYAGTVIMNGYIRKADPLRRTAASLLPPSGAIVRNQESVRCTASASTTSLSRRRPASSMISSRFDKGPSPSRAPDPGVSPAGTTDASRSEGLVGTAPCS